MSLWRPLRSFVEPVNAGALQGWIRAEVQVLTDSDADRIVFSHWEVALPRGFIAANLELQQILRGNAPASSLATDSQVGRVLALLQAQGCFTELAADAACSGRELRRHFDKLRSLWYASYYAHPIWARLRSGLANRNELFAWVVHNYHVSRVAGPVAARCATSMHPDAYRDRFLDDAFEEFWHADAYYFVRHPSLSVSDAHIKAYVPLTATRAFELHTLQTASCDSLGHTLIAYFQESSVHFFDDCAKFYATVEQAYGLEDFFEPWKEHMRVDLNQGHAAGVAALLDSDELIPAADRNLALRAAWIGYRYLYEALNDILGEARNGDELDLRQPEQIACLEPLNTPPLRRASDQLAVLGEDLLSCLFSGALAVLAHSVDHDELTAAGTLARAIKGALPNGNSWRAPPRSLWMEALQNQLRERRDGAFFSYCAPKLLSHWRTRAGFDPLGMCLAGPLHRLDRAVDATRLTTSMSIDAAAAIQFLDRALDGPLLDATAWQA